jgi:hypothetical protein
MNGVAGGNLHFPFGWTSGFKRGSLAISAHFERYEDGSSHTSRRSEYSIGYALVSPIGSRSSRIVSEILDLTFPISSRLAKVTSYRIQTIDNDLIPSIINCLYYAFFPLMFPLYYSYLHRQSISKKGRLLDLLERVSSIGFVF